MLAAAKPYSFLRVDTLAERRIPVLLSRLKCLIVESISSLFESLLVGCILHVNTSIQSGVDCVMRDFVFHRFKGLFYGGVRRNRRYVMKRGYLR